MGDEVRDPEAVLRALQAERDLHRETRAKARADVEELKRQLGEAGKREAHWLRKLTNAERRAERHHADAIRLRRLEAALDAGLPREAAERLIGTDPDELAADARRFADLRATAR